MIKIKMNRLMGVNHPQFNGGGSELIGPAMNLQFPDGKSFAFTVFDDTDNATVENVRPVYDLLYECGIRTTKSVWVYPPRGTYVGASLQDKTYVRFLIELKERGFEIGLHNVGDGRFSRKEIQEGFELFRQILGHYPSIHANHEENPDNLYWWDKRFEWPISMFYRHFRDKPEERGGETPASELFWGDIAKQHIRYIRNLTFNGINTLAYDPRMPYQVDSKSACSNLWFSSSNGDMVREFSDLISTENVDRLESEGGICIVYTHFASGFVGPDGSVHSEFERNLRQLARRSGWFVPVSTLLNFLYSRHGHGRDPGYLYRLGTNLRWGAQRISKKVRYGR